jgi:type I restriction enzyme S subunit
METGVHYPLCLDELPSSWRVGYVGDFARDIEAGFASGEHNQNGNGVAHLRPMNVDRRGKLDLSVVKFVSAEKDDRRLSNGDVLFNNTNSPELVGKTAVMNLRGDFAFSNHMTRIRFADNVVPKFGALQLNFLWMRGYFKYNCFRHVNQASVSARALARTIPFVWAPVTEQERIVAEIEKQFSRLDEAVANLKRVKANFKRYKASVLQGAIKGELLNGIDADNWRKRQIAEVADVIGGLTKNPKRQSLPRKMPYLRVANVYANELRLDDVEEIGVADNEVKKLLLRRGDLLVVEGNGSVDQIGRVALWTGAIPNCVHQNHLIKVRFGEEVVPEWALIWLLSPTGRQEIERVSSSTSGLHTLSTGKVGKLLLPVPQVPEQLRLVDEVDRRMSVIREAESEVDVNLKRAEALRQSILHRAFAHAQ